jgi:hypothetical protein
MRNPPVGRLGKRPVLFALPSDAELDGRPEVPLRVGADSLRLVVVAPVLSEEKREQSVLEVADPVLIRARGDSVRGDAHVDQPLREEWLVDSHVVEPALLPERPAASDRELRVELDPILVAEHRLQRDLVHALVARGKVECALVETVRTGHGDVVLTDPDQ